MPNAQANRMKRCAFLTLDSAKGFVIDDQLAYGPLEDLGWQVEAIPWTRPKVRWSAYDAVVIRSTWDYTADPDTFLFVLSGIEQSGVPLFNNLDVVRWNVEKTYLRELAERGVPVVPTAWRKQLCSGELPTLFDELGIDEVVVKPIVGAGANGTFRIDRRRLTKNDSAELESYYANRALMVQPFLQAVVTEGEYSMFYFNGEFSHAIIKTPQADDFRVQEEHGGRISPVVAEAELHSAGARALHAIAEPPLYARADFVRNPYGAGFWLMELELIEPSLYFRMDAESPRRFAYALDARVPYGT
jgi:glutathione synthase/RimK-type ligase-like ATP-grasp enzyme